MDLILKVIILVKPNWMPKLKILLFWQGKNQSHAGRHFYGTENAIWAGFGPIGNTEKKKFGTIEDDFFMFSGGKSFFIYFLKML